MNFKLTLKLLAILFLILCAFMAVPASIAWWLGEKQALKAFLTTISTVSMSSAAVFYALSKYKADSLKPRDSFVFVTLSWAMASFIGALPFYFSNAIPSFTDAYFETMSGFTTTGASILTNIEVLPNSILFWRSLTHWLGGMGIVVLAVAILPFLGIGGMQLIEAEAPGPTVDKITPRITETAKLLWLIYMALTAALVLFLMLGGISLFDSLIHTFGTLGTGGFSNKNLSVGHYNSWYVELILTIFMLLAGMNFSLHYRFLTGKAGSLLKDTEFLSYSAIFVGATLIIAFDLYGKAYTGVLDCLRYASFQVSSIMTTTGFMSADFEKWPMASQNILFFLMFVGGCSGSTGGGIKVIRLVTLFKQAAVEMKRLIHPRGVFALKISESVVKPSVANAVSGFFFLYIMMLLLTTFVVSTGEHDILTSFTAALTTLGNIGPGFGLVGPTENFSFFSGYIKWFLSFSMLIGRLEIYTVLVVFTPYFWKK